MPRNKKHRLRQLRISARNNRIYIFQRHRFPRRPLRSHLKLVHHHLQLASGILRDLIKPRHDLIAPAARTALRIAPRRQCQSCPATHQLLNQCAHRLLIHGLPRDRSSRPRQNFRVRLALCGFRWITLGVSRRSRSVLRGRRPRVKRKRQPENAHQNHNKTLRPALISHWCPQSAHSLWLQTSPAF